ncbi:MAG: class I poly(R)-hydroxyalkanoic acid synthase [Alphaproteobacteria bacterium]|nr:MAG: class I poly(R)-hydroxyalkanoic acid synthase [Alphaproteobacteria bacterium]
MRYQKLMSEFLERQAEQHGSHLDPLNITNAFMALNRQLLADPARLAQTQLSLWQDYMKLWQSTSMRLLGQEHAPVIDAPRGDRRFKGEEWRNVEVFDFIKQAYLLTAKHLTDTVANVDGLDPKARAKVDFYTRQFIDAMSPSNFVLTNPQVLKATIEEKGENLLRGLSQVLEDLERGHGRLDTQITDTKAFEVGVNVAVTPGKVVFENRMFQLIQYAPLTEQVHKVPLLIIPPWINKFYILDLTPEKSFVRWATEQGHTVFIMSWVNPDERYRDTDFEDYMLEGVLAACDAIEQATGEPSCNVIGYCIGGTLLTATLAYLHAKGQADRVKSATFFTAQADFTDAGELLVFVDEEQLAAMDRMMAQKGYLDGAVMAQTFNMLRSNDLIWSYVVNNYLLGRDPLPFDLLYWNADSTRLPRAMVLYYLKNMYQENNLVKPGKLVLGGVPIDLRTIKTPSFIQAGKDDHIAPFVSAYKLVHLLKGPTTFVLAGSGHIAGVVNPPAARKYQYWTNRARPANAQDWLAKAEEHPGSWWPYWASWLKRRAGPMVPARQPGDGKLTVIEDAPGRYVKVKG